MKALGLVLTGTATLASGLAALSAQAGLPPSPGPSLPAARREFAARLAQRPPLVGPDAWTVIGEASAWTALSADRDRQAKRWDYARSLIGRGRGSEAIGVLDVMQQDDPDLRMVEAFRLARGAALTLIRRYPDAVAEFDGRDDGAPLATPEACAWRMRLFSESGDAADALAHAGCAWPAVRARAAADRKPFLIAAARSAVESGQPAYALRWLEGLPDRDPAANLYRGRALVALGHPDRARLRIARVLESGTGPERAEARLAMIEGGVADGTLGPRAALLRLEQFHYDWRGDPVEERALRLTYRLADRSQDAAGALTAGATLLRYFGPQHQPPGFATGVQAKLATLVAPGTRVPLDRAAGLFWDYRDLLPSGVAGDEMVSGLSERLQRAGLYQRAAALLEYQLFSRAQDLAQGPLSARTASLFILAGRPDHALTVLNRTNNIAFTDDMLGDRRRVEAVALYHTGRVQKALSLLNDVPASGALRAELLWKQRNWQALAATLGPLLPEPVTRATAPISDVDQAIVLRQAIALAMLGRGADLQALHGRYAATFAALPSASLFNMLTGPVEALDPALISRAMAAMPAASPAGSMADLIDAPMGRV
ncbi:hypothetical protein HL653_06270 [Sphingomonas sp. AP4-R1]|uniref:hypothetical protein n=1 Tax=Sphingomonas sp. AP4-R1 TaxID=2735134 RepID=UPI00149399DE|nr:hypothetical protein [Sphingomonas sp. AP4-R1]QJU57449.1 hypothetical protein HL653_06270 [Sphingomonas sp. AP4-R1]